METNKLDFLFIDTNIYRGMKNKNIITDLKKISKKYKIVIPVIQFHELQEHLLSKYYEAFKYLDNISNVEKFFKSNDDLKTKEIGIYLNNTLSSYKKLSELLENEKIKKRKELCDFLESQIIIDFSSKAYYGAINRKKSKQVPYEPKEKNEHDYYDCLIWETLLNSTEKDIPKESNLYIWSNDISAFYSKNEKKLHNILETEWKIHKKGVIKEYKNTSIDIIEEEEDRSGNLSITIPSITNTLSEMMLPYSQLDAIGSVLRNNILGHNYYKGLIDAMYVHRHPHSLPVSNNNKSKNIIKNSADKESNDNKIKKDGNK